MAKPTIPNNDDMAEVMPTSPLDMWALRKFGAFADMVKKEDVDELIGHILDSADDDVSFWEERNARFMDSQRYWAVGDRRSKPSIRESTMAQVTGMPDEGSTSGEVVELNDGYTIVEKITAMVSGAFWGIDVQPSTPEMDDTAQDIEDFLRWCDKELDSRHTAGLNATYIRDEVHYATLRGWITGMVLPNPKDRSLPFTYILEDPLFVYPRYSGDRLVRVIHRYNLSTLEAQSEFPNAFEFLLEFDEEDELEVTEYWDDIYRVSILSEGPKHSEKSKAREGSRWSLLHPLQRHSYRTVDGQPMNPWIIVVPRGSPTRRLGDIRDIGDRKRTAALIGLDALHPVKSIIDHLEKLASMQMTEVAKGVNPAHILFYDGTSKPYELDFGAGAENYLVLGQQDVKILETSTMRPDAMPLLNLLNDRLQKGSIPSVLYGQANFSLAGYAINLLSQGAQDVVKPILDGVKAFRAARFRRMLEMYVTVIADLMDPVAFGTQDPTNDKTYTGMKTLDPEKVKANGIHVEVSYDNLLPKDAQTIIPMMVAANQAGLLPLYDAMKNIGVRDPRQALQRLAEGFNYQDPLIQKHLARQAGERSGSELLKAAIAAAREEEAQLLQMQQAAQAEGSGTTGKTPPGGAPPRNSGEVAAQNQLNDVSASLNVKNGASAPTGGNSLLEFLERSGG